MYQKPHGSGGGDDWGGGGQFQRLIGLTKHSLYKSIGRSQLTYNELEEILLDVEINFIPLTIQMNGQKDKDMYNDVKTMRGKDGNMNTRNRQTRQN